MKSFSSFLSEAIKPNKPSVTYHDTNTPGKKDGSHIYSVRVSHMSLNSNQTHKVLQLADKHGQMDDGDHKKNRYDVITHTKHHFADPDKDKAKKMAHDFVHSLKHL